MSEDKALVTATLACALAGVVALGEHAPRLRVRREHAGYAGNGACGEVDIAADGVHIRFAWTSDDDGDLDFAELSLAALPGLYRIDALAIDGEWLPDVRRRVVAVQDQLLVEAGAGALRVLADQGPPVLELDLRGLPAPVAAMRTVSLRIAREAVAAEFLHLVQERVDAAAAVSAARLRHFDDVLLAQAEVVDRTSREASDQRMRLSASTQATVHVDGDATRALVSSWAERQAGMPGDMQATRAALASLESDVQRAGEARTIADARLQGIEGDLARLSSLVTALDSQLRERDDAAMAASSRVEERLDAAMAASSRVEERVKHVIWAMENVFWRRWLRRLRGPRR